MKSNKITLVPGVPESDVGNERSTSSAIGNQISQQQVANLKIKGKWENIFVYTDTNNRPLFIVKIKPGGKILIQISSTVDKDAFVEKFLKTFREEALKPDGCLRRK